MKFTLDWLKDHLETTATATEIGEALTTIGLEVESIEDQGRALKPFVVAKVVSAIPHPNSDHLKVCKVDAGTGALIDVVCGAPNATTGMKSVFAFPGTYIPGKDFELKAGVVIRGQPSNGMLCSAMELELSNDHEGIIVLPDDAPIGMPYVEYAKLGGVVFDISITPNRGDATSVLGVARDLAAFGIGTLRDGAIAPQPSPGGASPIAVELRFAEGEPEACRMFAGRLISGVKNGPSPSWLQDRLRAIGLRPISALVDITNYITYDRGRPLHVFDADKLKSPVHARMARAGESLLALDGHTYALDPTIPVIADANGAVGIAGIIGGEPTSSTDATVNVFVESAWFDPMVTAQAGRKLGVVTDARYRFERGVDPTSQVPGLELATRMILALCGGTPHEIVVAGHVEPPGTVIEFPVGEVKRLTGLDLPAPRIAELLTRLGFAVTGAFPTLTVKVPSWRPDVTQKADLVEEVMRMEGVDKVPVDPLPRLSGVAPRMLTTLQSRRRIAKRVLAARGLDEAVTWSFISADEAARFGGGKPELKLANAIAADLSDMRPSLLPGLLAAARRNQNRGFDAVALFEVGQVFLSAEPEGQHTYVTALRSGAVPKTWDGGGTLSVFDAKADLAAVLDGLGHDLDKLQLVGEAPAWAHPGRGGRVQLGPAKIIGWFGELHPAWAAELGLTGPVAAFELDLDAIPEPRRKATRGKGALKLSDLMPVERDFAFLVDRNVAAANLLKAARNADKALIANVAVFDLFEGKGVESGKKSIAIRVTLQPMQKTLTDEEIDKVSASIVAAVGKATGGALRA
ncbi:MAG: phenylalanine--tRNA ligase subunit beta [Devosia sp. 67-54]|uniref:phenylalanine--tRNA ligase subunit beta n=1 Tax=unclassified Devosia TaxID=196773 RepID=UPI00086F03CC|nr:MULTISPECIES: phenylalanine--tRNA ligase subunit beta [unclassified Devosia]MBN9304996.1 phenylalanine--tRNA ligase subunit beta [Devosia sp.]ODU62734.1 MAG: phenylalanine--tRNA ligase subunit beta [Pelagibacterium sp. SCN 68-10]OJX15059.1 MAG: phenylalanine--tRNA ligase subunit beta [Devosia sp. 67-54]